MVRADRTVKRAGKFAAAATAAGAFVTWRIART